MSPGLPASLGAELLSAFAQKGYGALTPVQAAVLDPALSGRDLRITSQTGSGKTVAIGLALRDVVTPRAPDDDDDGENTQAHASAPASGRDGRPRALVVAPTRELAKQMEEELTWLYAPLSARVVSVTGGASYRDEKRSLSSGAAIVVGTPGRLLDHLQRGSIDASGLGAVVLDEADRLLDLGFRDDLEAILAFAPEGHQTHLVSATFPREVEALANATQDDPVHVEGTRLGAANADIDHIVHLVDSRERVHALINILLANPEEQTLVFARTRADVAAIAQELRAAGFAVSSLSGEMEQSARNRALSGFKSGDLRVLVATDVAARGIDVQDIARVVHAEPPSDADGYTHRSGRTGRAGRKGTSAILAIPAQLARTTFLLQRAGVPYRFEPIPSAETIRQSADERMSAALVAEDSAEAGGIDERTWALAKRVIEKGNPTRAIARLLARARYAGPTEPRVVRSIDPPNARSRPGRDRAAPARGPMRDAGEYERGPERDRRPSFRGNSPGQGPREARSPSAEPSWVPFRVTWGQEQGADARRLLAVVCRRGGIRGTDVGSIRVGETDSVVNVASHVADAFAAASAAIDPREPRVLIRPERGSLPPSLPAARREDDAPSRAPTGDRSPRRPHANEHRETPRKSQAIERDSAPRHEAPRRSQPHERESAPPRVQRAAPRPPSPSHVKAATPGVKREPPSVRRRGGDSPPKRGAR